MSRFWHPGVRRGGRVRGTEPGATGDGVVASGPWIGSGPRAGDPTAG